LDLTEIIGELRVRAGIAGVAEQATVVSGGSINRVFRVPSDQGIILLKVNDVDGFAMFEAEVEGLDALRDARGIAVPKVLHVGRAGPHSYLALEWVEFGAASARAETRLGRGLARQHRVTSGHYGWHRDNNIGATPQPNTPSSSWLEFLREHRLGFQLKLAEDKGLPQREQVLGCEVLDGLGAFFAGHVPAASLLHGDLWSGNWGASPSEEPYVFDPAVYFGDREADLAMTRLFGGFGAGFYEAYQAEWPLTEGWEVRVDLYNLYHLLNHFNLFGAGYLPQVARVLERLTGRRS